MTTAAEVRGLLPDVEIVEAQVGPVLMFGTRCKDGIMVYTQANQTAQAVADFFRMYAL